MNSYLWFVFFMVITCSTEVVRDIRRDNYGFWMNVNIAIVSFFLMRAVMVWP